MHGRQTCPSCHPPAGGLEAWQPARLAQLCGAQLFKVTKPFLSGGEQAFFLQQTGLPVTSRRGVKARLPSPCWNVLLPLQCTHCPACNPGVGLTPPGGGLPPPAGRTKMRLADYLSYCGQQKDEEPLYIFDS